MRCCQLLLLIASLLILTINLGSAEPTPEPEAEAEARRKNPAGDAKFVVITEDEIPDAQSNKTLKVIRVNPLDLPPLKDDPTSSMDSSLYNIQSLPRRNYVNSNRMRMRQPHPAQAPPTVGAQNFPEVKAYKGRHKKNRRPKLKLHFLYDQDDLEGGVMGRRMDVHVAPGAYPVYYAVSKSNGRFGKFPLKGFRNQEDFLKYLIKSKSQLIENYES